MTTPDPQVVREIADEVFCPCPDFPKRVTLDLSEGDVTIRHVVCGNVMVTDWPYLRAHALPLTLAWVSDGEDEDWLELKAVADEQAQADRDAEPKPCVCGDPSCMPYWRPVHEQMNAMRVRADKASADFTMALLEQVCELGTELDELRARRDGEAERDADVRRGMAALLDAVEIFRAWLTDAYDPDAPAPDPATAMYQRAAELRAHIAALAELDAREQEGGVGCPCGCPVVADMCSCPEPCPCEPDCAYCLTPNPMRQPDGGAS